ncbi:50S ribosomal protein L11 methyltransferase [Pseudoblastomonas halimionae]|uniref:Ribosomal protein L11 methyltransferase n=1 Tax=Alteriqipengyuania halimionae TaxID=1926630 RepID=A0A6I4U5G8_9SPHN|nr:50S ribosomal protein L11 methyltransferase [Alteriqipengyuania halimionae]MXP09702.1 methyltransferase [Alteriqipengyuania halimionae]
MSSWKLTAFGRKPVIEAALARQDETLDWDHEIVLTGFEIAEDKPDDWRLDAYLPRKPRNADRAAIAALFDGKAPDFAEEKLPEADWLTESQRGLDPIRAGRFHIHTPDHAPDPDAVNFEIPAAQAFGTGHHNTTAGCLAMLDAIKRSGLIARDVADIGTGTGLLAFAARALWPRARFTATDIDPVCLGVIEDNAAMNAIPLGAMPGDVMPIIAPGTDDAAIQVRAPYDLLIANILARPLIDLAPDFADITAPGASVLLAGLLETQEAAVRRAYRRQGFRLAARLVDGDWSILWLRKRAGM